MAKRKAQNTPIDLQIDPKQFIGDCMKRDAALVDMLDEVAQMFGGPNTKAGQLFRAAAECGRQDMKRYGHIQRKKR